MNEEAIKLLKDIRANLNKINTELEKQDIESTPQTFQNKLELLKLKAAYYGQLTSLVIHIDTPT